MEPRLNRRRLLGLLVVAPIPYLAQAHSQSTLPATPACPDDDEPTPPQTEGPFYKTRNPQRTSLLEPGMPGTRLVLQGYVLSTACRPVTNALVDFWQADASGQYDNVGFKLRGHQFTDNAGRYYLETVVPGLYPGRTRHLHVKVQAPNRTVLTSQLYFPNEAANNTDRIFNRQLVVQVQKSANLWQARFDFVVRL